MLKRVFNQSQTRITNVKIRSLIMIYFLWLVCNYGLNKYLDHLFQLFELIWD